MNDTYYKLRSQIRAGRELCGLKQSDVAELLGASLSKVSRAESGETKSGDVLLEIKGALEKSGIRFTTNGVELIDNHIEILEGEDCYLRLLDDVYLSLAESKDKELLVLFGSDKESSPEVIKRHRFMRSNNIQMRKLIEENDHYIMGELEEYRCIPSEYFTNVVTLIYNDKVAQVNSTVTIIAVQHDPQLATKERKVFNYFWDTGVKPKKSISTERF